LEQQTTSFYFTHVEKKESINEGVMSLFQAKSTGRNTQPISSKSQGKN